MDLLKNLNNMSVPTAEDFKNYSGFIEETDRLIEFAKLHAEAALLEASEKATVNINGFIQEYDENCCVDKDSILNAYPLENIK